MPARVGRADDSAQSLLPWQYSRPGQLRAEYFVDDALKAASVPPEVIMAIRPPVPQQIDPPRFGYRNAPLNVRDVLATDRFAPKFRSWVSGASAMGYVDEDAHMSAGLRNFIEANQR